MKHHVNVDETERVLSTPEECPEIDPLKFKYC